MHLLSWAWLVGGRVQVVRVVGGCGSAIGGLVTRATFCVGVVWWVAGRDTVLRVVGDDWCVGHVSRL